MDVEAEHIDYALTIPEVKETLKKEGWRRRA